MQYDAMEKKYDAMQFNMVKRVRILFLQIVKIIN